MLFLKQHLYWFGVCDDFLHGEGKNKIILHKNWGKENVFAQ